MQQRGIFVVLDGPDKSGKETQSKLLTRRIRSTGRAARLFSFPRYRDGASYVARQYLKGRYAGATPEQSSLGFTADRLDWWFRVGKPLLEKGKHVIADRWVISNLAHQGAKLANFETRRLYYDWQANLEHTDLALPRPDITIILRISPETRAAFMQSAGGPKDIHERDMAYLGRVAEAYLELSQLPAVSPKTVVVECDANGVLLTPDQVHERVWAHVAPLLAAAT